MIFRNTIGVLLLAVSSVLSYYMNDINSKNGYVSVQKSGRNYDRHGIRGMQRRHFSGGNKNYENIVDSHFKVKKTLPYLPYTPVQSQRVVHDMILKTEAPTQQQPLQEKDSVEDTVRQQEPVLHGIERERTMDNIQETGHSTVQRSRASVAEYRNPVPLQRINENIQMHKYQEIQTRYDAKPNVQMNFHKTQESTNPQKFRKLNNKQQLTSISLQRPDEKYQRAPTSVVIDKTLQKISTQSDRNYKVMSGVRDQLAHKVSDRRYRGDYKKRDTEYTDENGDKVNRNSISDNMRKFIVGKDKSLNLERKSTKSFSRIGSHEDSLESEDSPYAIFYRMQPETIYGPEGLSAGFIDRNNNVENAFSNKQKRLTVGYENEVDLQKKKKNSNSMKIHKKLKNFFNHRTL